MDLLQGLRGSSTCTSAPSGPLLTQMETLDELDVLVSALGDNSYRQQLMMYLSTLGGDTVVSFVDRIFGALFSERITCYVTFYGRRQGMKPSFGTHLYNLALEVFNNWNREQRSDRHQLERALRRPLNGHTMAYLNGVLNPTQIASLFRI
nr:unnamed protein product [Spirometra erinaceieuropaei]